MDKSKLKTIARHLEGINPKTLEGLARLANSKDFVHLAELIRVIKYDILRNEFSYPYSNSEKNAQQKAYYHGGDYFLTLVVNSVKKSGQVLDVLEEGKNAKDK